MMRNEHGELVSFVFIDNKDIGDCRLCKTWRKKLLMKKQNIPAGYRISWAGQVQT